MRGRELRVRLLVSAIRTDMCVRGRELRVRLLASAIRTDMCARPEVGSNAVPRAW